EILDEKPDLVVSGINIGVNVGMDTHYSGTVAAAMEAASLGAPAIAASMEGPGAVHHEAAARFVARLAEDVFRQGLPPGTMLNVNFPDLPPEKIAGVRVTSQAASLNREIFEKRTDPRDRAYYWRARGSRNARFSPGSDGAALANHFISITPLRCDATDHAFLEKARQASGSWSVG
ncbi:MAG: 5'/3'-nucleotidase SurE, partial [Desulfobacterales bacterium]|nr:5'/3'-nucleotidase SurE [Desulfobacterales bacterium]